MRQTDFSKAKVFLRIRLWTAHLIKEQFFAQKKSTLHWARQPQNLKTAKDCGLFVNV